MNERHHTFAALAHDEASLPAQVRRALIAARWAGVESFEDAWAWATRGVNGAGWFTACSGESPMAFLRRHMSAAWADQPAQRYCQHTAGCPNLTWGRLCALHDPAAGLATTPVPVAPQALGRALSEAPAGVAA